MPHSADKDRIAAIIRVIAELETYQNGELDRDMRENYRSAIGQLESLAYRLTERKQPEVIGSLPVRAQAARGPLPVIVRPSRSKRR